MNTGLLVPGRRVLIALGLTLLSPAGRVGAQSMTMPPSDLCAGAPDTTVVAKGATLAPAGSATFG